MLIPMGQVSEYTGISKKSNTLASWLLGYEFADTIILITEDKVVFLATPRKGNKMKMEMNL